MSDNLNETNNEINESNQSETVENKTETVEEQHTQDVTEATQQAANVDAKESSEQAKVETVNQTVMTTPTKKQNIFGSKVIATVGKGALAVLCGFGGAIQHKVEILVKQWFIKQRNPVAVKQLPFLTKKMDPV